MTLRIAFHSSSRDQNAPPWRFIDFFAPVQKTERSRLYKAVDAINARFGKGKVFSAAEGIGNRSWKMKRSKLSKRASTRWDELLTVR